MSLHPAVISRLHLLHPKATLNRINFGPYLAICICRWTGWKTVRDANNHSRLHARAVQKALEENRSISPTIDVHDGSHSRVTPLTTT